MSNTAMICFAARGSISKERYQEVWNCNYFCLFVINVGDVIKIGSLPKMKLEDAHFLRVCEDQNIVAIEINVNDLIQVNSGKLSLIMDIKTYTAAKHMLHIEIGCLEIIDQNDPRYQMTKAEER